MDNWCRKYYC